jgi:nucleoside 2-deoxyribosyltransferase
MNYYIASGLENAENVRKLKAILDAAGWNHTYDWTVHGSVQSEGEERLTEVASAESVGVFEADVVIVLLPGGRGTHAELGMAIGKLDLALWLHLRGANVQNPLDIARICIFSEDPEAFSGTNGKTCAFYHHPYVRRFSSMDEMLESLGVK